MAPTRRNKDGLIARVNFPLYTLQMLTSRHVLVAGGGGSSKTGVANGFEIFEVAHDGNRFIAEEVIRHETGPSVVMNCATYSNPKHTYLVAGQEGHCQLYNVQSLVVSDKDNSTKIVERNKNNETVRRRKNSERTNDKKKETEKSDQIEKPELKKDSNENDKRLMFVIKPADSIQTDFAKEEPIQRVVRISHNGKFMGTGGTDGHVRLWQFPSMKPHKVLKAHSKEIDDIDFSPYDNLLVSIAKDGLAILWDYNTGKEVRQLTWNPPEGTKYLFKRCRFGRVEDTKKNSLYMLANPLGRAGKQKGFLQKWSPDSGELSQVAGMDESLAALAVRDDGRFVAIGTMFSGSVSIYIAFSLQRVMHIPGAHNMFVTGLEFLPVVDNHTVSSVTEAAVLSISVDNKVCIHSMAHRVSIPAWLAILVIILTLFLTFLGCAYLGI